MKKLITAVCSLALLLNSTVFFADNALAQEAAGEVIEIHVSPAGADSNPGTKEKPLKTVEGAKKRVKSVRNEDRTVKVIFHEGEYRISKGITFTAEDAGFEGNPIIYMAAEGETPVFKGSVELDGSKFTAIEDQSVIDILPDKSKNKVAQLSLKSQGITSMGSLPAINYGGNCTVYNGLYLDGMEQTLSRWPNTGYTTMGKVVDSNTAIFEVNESNVTRWGHSPDMRFHGFTRWDWSYERAKIISVDPKTRQIQLNTSTIFDKKISIPVGRYYIVNILEELDEPGEWYVDAQKMLLYYYPVYPVTDAKLEMSVLAEAIFNLEKTHDLVFDGLSFEQTRNDAIYIGECENITLTNNSYKNIGRNAISGSKASENTAANRNSSDIEISNSEFNNIGSIGISLDGGDYDTLEPSGIVIKNNHFARCGQTKRGYAGAVQTRGVGTVIEHNVMEDMPHQAVACSGSLHQINYNEIFNVCYDSNDMGAIYAGRDATWRGVEVKYNYIHDIVPDERLAGMVCGVYWDDNQSGNIMKYNIFENIPRAVMVNGGNDHLVENNIFIDCPMAARFGYTDDLIPRQELFITAVAKAEQFPVYYEKFPEMKTIDINWTRSHNNRLLNNYMVNSYGSGVDGTDPEMWSGKDLLKQNLAKGNVSVTKDTDSFVDAESGNYEIKDTSEILKTLPELAKIKMADIGIQGKEINEEDGEFIKIFPKNGQTQVSTGGFYLKWQPSEYYTKYHVQVATDPEFKNVIFEETTVREYVLCDVLEAGGKVYYWNVMGIAGTVTGGLTEKASYGSAYIFRTPKNEKLDKAILAETISAADKLYESLTPGNQAGQCEQQYLTWYKEIINKAKAMNSLTFGDQNEVNSINEELNNATQKMASYIYKNFAGIEDWLNTPEKWAMTGEQKLEDGVLTLHRGHALYDEYVKTFNVYKFNVKIEDFTHMFVVTYKANGSGDPWVPGSRNFSFYFKNNIFEFQRYMGGVGGMIDTKPNDGLLKEGEWAEIAVGAMDVPGGIQVYVTVNGKEIFNYFDDTGAITPDGYMQLSAYGPITAQVKAVDDLGTFDQSIVMGGEVTYKEPVDFDKSLLVASNIKAVNGSASESNGEIIIKAKSPENSFTFNKPVDNNNIYTFDAKLNTEDSGQAIAIRGIDSENEYRIRFKEGKIVLERYFDGNKQTLFVGKNRYTENDRFAQIKIGSCDSEYGTRVFLYIDGQKVFDCTDMYKEIKMGGLKFYDNNMKGMIIR